MITVFFVLSLIPFIIFANKLVKEYEYLKKIDRNNNVELNEKGKFYVVILSIFGAMSIICLGLIVFCIYTVGTGVTISQKISMYEEENVRIEESIDTLVKNYMDFEASTYIELKDKDAINLIALFPELKSDTLVQQQMDIYISNNKQIRELKEQQIDLQKARWNLYFGR